MAFVVQCPFCSLRARVPDRANGAIGRCPKCANSFTLGAADDQSLPDSVPADGADAAEMEPVDPAAVGVAIAAAAAAAKEPTPIEVPQPPTPTGFQPAGAAGALALLLSGCALLGGSIAWLRGFVLPLSGLALLTGLTALALTRLSVWPRFLLPIAGSAAAAVMLIIAWLFPALLGPAYENLRQRRTPTPIGLHAIPLAAAPALAGPPEWVDAKRYALQRDGLRVQVIGVSLYRPAPENGKPEPSELLVVRVRLSLERGAKPLQRKDQPAPTLTDAAGKPFALRKSEFFERGDGKSKTALFPMPTIEETFAFEAPDEGWKTMRLELPAARWSGAGVFQFTIANPGEPAVRPKGGK